MPEVFLMEDSPALRRMLISQMRDAGYNVTAFENGNESRDTALMKQADVLVTDLSMPGVDGITAIRNVADQRPELPIIVITGNSVDEVAGMPSIDRILRKPFSDETLIEAIETALSKGREQAEPVYTRQEFLVSSLEPENVQVVEPKTASTPLSWLRSLFRR